MALALSLRLSISLPLSLYCLVPHAELKDTGKYTCKHRQTGEATDCNVTIAKAPVRLIKGLPETLTVPQGKVLFASVRVECDHIHRVESKDR